MAQPYSSEPITAGKDADLGSAFVPWTQPAAHGTVGPGSKRTRGNGSNIHNSRGRERQKEASALHCPCCPSGPSQSQADTRALSRQWAELAAGTVTKAGALPKRDKRNDRGQGQREESSDQLLSSGEGKNNKELENCCFLKAHQHPFYLGQALVPGGR